MDKVTPIRDDVVMTKDKQTFLDTIAKYYDETTATFEGEAPVAIVFAFVVEKGGCRAGYHTLDVIDDRNLLYISRAVTCIQTDIGTWDKPHG